MNINQMKKKLIAEQARLSKIRDNLRSLERDIDEQAYSIETAMEHLEDAVNCLSELV